MDFQLILNVSGAINCTLTGQRFIFFTVGTSYLVGANYFYNVAGVDDEGNNYTGIMTRGRRGEFFVQNLTLVV